MTLIKTFRGKVVKRVVIRRGYLSIRLANEDGTSEWIHGVEQSEYRMGRKHLYVGKKPDGTKE